MAARPRKRLTEDEHLALQVLAGNPRGLTVEGLVLGRGLKLQTLTDLVRAKLAKRYHLTVTAGSQTTGVTVTYVMITAAGRKALAP